MDPATEENTSEGPNIERLDYSLKVVGIRGWIVLLFLIGILGSILIWSFFGAIPITVSGRSIVLEEGGKNKILVFLPLYSGLQVGAGMKSVTSLDTRGREKFGLIEGVVKEISQYPVDTKSAALQEIASDSLRDFLVSGSYPMILGIVEPVADGSNPTGVKWTSTRVPDGPIRNGSIGETIITLKTLAPFSYVFPNLKKDND